MDLPHHLHQILFCSFALFFLYSPASSLPFQNNTDRMALLAFRSALSDPLGALDSWNNESLHFCRWRGVACSKQHPGRVVALDLDSLGLVGPISPSISNLTFLRSFHMPYNNLHGDIPSELGHLFRLEYLNLSINYLEGTIPSSLSDELPFLTVLDLSGNKLVGSIPPLLANGSSLNVLSLSGNSLTGSIPTSLGSSLSLAYLDLSINSLTGNIPHSLGNSTSLQTLVLSQNNLSGEIPPSLGNNPSLHSLDLAFNSLRGVIPPFSSPVQFLGLSSNQLSGVIPPSLGNLSSLLYLYLAQNKLEGSIPSKLGNIPELQELDLTYNSLSGTVPSSLYNLSSMSYFGVGNNRLYGELPPDIGISLPKLQSLIMQGNHFQGPIPASICNASELQTLDLSNNSFTGSVPSNLGSLPNLQVLNIGWNQLQAHDWGFLSTLSNCSLLEKLYLQDNKLEGVLSQSVGNLSTRLQLLMIGMNQISGSIPAEIGNLVNLTVLYMDGNHLTENIPATIGNLQNLQVLNLSSNQISGPIPFSIGNLTRLNEVYMQNNELSGPIPASFGSYRYLNALNLSHNTLSGSIPKEIVEIASLTRFLDLSHNSLTGSLPEEVGSLINLGHLDVSENQLSGEIPHSLGDCQVLEYLSIEGNFIQGSIPQSFINLEGIKHIDLSRNNLSGKIPEFLETFRSLQYLNLSFNDLEGEVPKRGVFANASELYILGNKRLCGGDPMLKLPSCDILSTDRSKRSRILIIVIPTVSVVIISVFCLFGILYQQRKVVKGDPCLSSPTDKHRKLSYSDILKATEGFSLANLIGSGSFGSVYKGIMDIEQKIVAVKVLHLHQIGAFKSFAAECAVLRNIRHRNLIKILNLCSGVDFMGKDFKALVFEYMPNGSLEKWLHPQASESDQPRKLNLIQRLNIAIDVASALDYLHHSCVPQVVHCDIKPSNILLDNDMTAHVGDFGLARWLSSSISVSKNSTSLTGIKGSIGYVAPEYGIGSKISTQGDVYSYGVLLLEMLTRMKPTDDMFKDGLDLHKYVGMAFPDRIMGTLDPQIVQEDVEAARANNINRIIDRSRIWGCILSLIRIGLSCSQESPSERIDMRDVSLTLLAIKEHLLSVEAHEDATS